MCFCINTAVLLLMLFFDRYPIGELSLPFFTQWVMDKFEIDLNLQRPPKPLPKPDDFPPPIMDAGNL